MRSKKSSFRGLEPLKIVLSVLPCVCVLLTWINTLSDHFWLFLFCVYYYYKSQSFLLW